MKKSTVYSLVICFIFGLAACASDSKKIEADLNQPINCATAEADIRVLQSEKTHAAQQLANGVTAVVPAGAVVGIVTGSEKGKLKMATGEYNRLIDQKIKAIKSTCGIK